MSPRYPSDWLEELRQRADIVQIIGSYVNLKRSSNRFVGLCPFHNETAPSFSVDSQKQLYHCFGCKAGGTVFRFIMDMEHLSFTEAVAFLADKTNMQLPQLQYDPDYNLKKSKKEKMYNANKMAAMIYHNVLWEEEGAPVLEYFKSRGLSDSIIRKFGLGAAVGGNPILNKLMQEGFTEDELVETGLISRKNNRVFDVFKQRAMFPIIDLYGNVVGFGGRALGDAMPKYLNTAETLVFNKRKNVFASNFLRKEKALDRVLLVEGYMDVVALMQYDLRGVVATLGTALTEDQAILMGRFAKEVHICYDGDNAGQKATEKAIKIFEEHNIEAKVLVIPDKQDPDDYIRKYGKEKFEELPTMSTTSFKLKREKQNLDMSKEENRIQYAKRCADILAGLKNPIDIESHIKNIIIETGFSREVLLAQIAVVRPDIHKSLIKEEKAKARQIENKIPKYDVPQAEKQLMAVLFTNSLPLDLVNEEAFSSSLMKNVFLELCNSKTAAQIMDELQETEERAVLSNIFNLDLPNDESELMQIAQDCLKKIKKQKLTDEYRELQQSLATLSLNEQAEITKQASQILQQLKSL